MAGQTSEFASGMRRRPAALVIVAIVATSIVYALIASPRPSSGLASGDPVCDVARDVQVCSHQLKGMASLRVEDPPVDGSLAGMTAMWREGITCFDVDGSLTSDGSMLATHPRRFADATGGKMPDEVTLRQAREAGAADDAFPTLDDLIAHFASLVNTEPPDFRPPAWRGTDSFARRSASGSSGSRHRSRRRRRAAPELTGPVLCLDLKGEALAPQHATRLAALATSLGIAGRVLVYVYDGGDGDAVLAGINERHPNVAVGLGRRDENAQHWDVTALPMKGIAALVPSAGFDGGWYAKAVLTGVHVINWVVDDEAAMRTSLLNGVSGFITNEPGRMLRALRDTQRWCERK